MKPRGKKVMRREPKGFKPPKTIVHKVVDRSHMVILGERGMGTLRGLAAKLGMGESEAMEYLLGQVRVLRGG